MLIHTMFVELPEVRFLLSFLCAYNLGLQIHFKWGFLCEKFWAVFPGLKVFPSRMILLLFLLGTTEMLLAV